MKILLFTLIALLLSDARAAERPIYQCISQDRLIRVTVNENKGSLEFDGFIPEIIPLECDKLVCTGYQSTTLLKVEIQDRGTNKVIADVISIDRGINPAEKLTRHIGRLICRGSI